MKPFSLPIAAIFLFVFGDGVRAQDPAPALVQSYSLSELLELRTRIDNELRRRGVMRSANQLTGELAEFLFAGSFGWTLASNSQKSHDAEHEGVRYQIKARRDYGQSGARQLSADSVEKLTFASAEIAIPNPARAPVLSGFSRFLRCGKDLRQFAEVLGGGGEEEFVICTAWAT